MTMKSQWKQKLDILNEYIESNQEIYIDTHEISIPEHLRGRFYDYFDDIRNTFVNDFFASLPMDVDSLKTNYIESEKKLIDCLEIERVDLPVDLMSFLHEPREGMVRWLYNRLFEMIQKKITIEEFEEISENDLTSTAYEMYRLGYETWAIFSLILLLEPDETCSVELDDDYEPVPGKLREIAFGRQYNHSTKRIPEFIVHSRKLGSYAALKMPLAREVDGYYVPHEVPKKMMRDRTGDTSFALDSRVMFISILKDLNKIPVYADLGDRKIKSPDMIVEFLNHQDIADDDKLTHIKNRIELMKPKAGTGVIIINPDSNPVPALEDMDLFSVGFDKSKLENVIEKLIPENSGK